MGEFTGSETGLDPEAEGAQERINRMRGQAEHQLAELRERADSYSQQAREQLQRVDESITTFARANPLAAVAGALAAGFIIGRLGSKL